MVLYGVRSSSQVWMGQVPQCEIAEDGLHHLRLILEQLSSWKLRLNNLVHTRKFKSRNWCNMSTRLIKNISWEQDLSFSLISDISLFWQKQG